MGNSAYKIKKFIFTNTSDFSIFNETENINTNANINFNMTIRNFNSNSTEILIEKKSFHVYLIEINLIPHFDFLYNPGICCSEIGGYICDKNFLNEKSEKINKNINNNNTTFSIMLKDHSLFYKDYFFFGKNNTIEINNSNNTNNTNKDSNFILELNNIKENSLVININEVIIF